MDFIEIKTENSVVISKSSGVFFGYFGWPTIARMKDNTLVVGASGFRHTHVCPWGKEVLFYSHDNGKTWPDINIVFDSPIDDRDTGVISLNDGGLLVSWISVGNKKKRLELFNSSKFAHVRDERTARQLEFWDEDIIDFYAGNYVMKSSDGETFDEPVKTPIFTPHGPIQLLDGSFLYMGKVYEQNDEDTPEIQVYQSKDAKTWSFLSNVPVPDDPLDNCVDPHICQISTTKLIGMIRCRRNNYMRTLVTYSDDGGKTWSPAKSTEFSGSPPHLIRHSSGAIICTYGFRGAPDKKPGKYGQLASISYDDGMTWQGEYVIRMDSDDSDLGYPSTVELSDGSLISVYYQKLNQNCKNGILLSRWELPKQIK